MPFCVNDECKGRISALAKFCSHCGTDNRPPHKKGNTVRACSHFGIDTDFCPRCGGEVGYDQPGAVDAGTRRTRSRMILGSLFLVVLIPTLYYALATIAPIPGHEWAQNRINEEIYVTLDEDYYEHRVQTKRGYRDFITLAGLSLFLGYGTIYGAKTPLRRKR